MINTPITKKANEIAQRVFSGKTDITGYPCMRMRNAVATQMKNEFTVAIALLMDVYDYSGLNYMTLMKEGMPMRVAFALCRFKQINGEPHTDYLKRLAADDELVYPVALAAAEYLSNLNNYKDNTVKTIAEYAHHSTTCYFLKLYHNGKS